MACNPAGLLFKIIIPRLLGMMLFLFLSNQLSAQLTQPVRFESEHKGSDQNYTVISMHENGVALLHQTDKYEGNNHLWEILLLDSTLQKTWEYKMALSPHLNLIGFDYIDGEVYFLYRMGSGDLGALTLVQIKIREHLFAKYEIETKLDFKLAYFNVIGHSALLGGYVSRQPTVFMHELTTGRSKVVPGFFQRNTELLDVRANSNGTFNTLIMDRSSAEKKQLVVQIHDETGAIILDDAIEVDANKSILTGVTSTLFRDELMITGTWAAPNGKAALGIYTVPVDPFDKQTIRYYDLSEFDHFLDYNSPRKVARIKAKTARRKKNGKLPLWSAFVNTARLVEDENNFILLSEIYSPSTTSSSYYNPYSNNPYYNPAMAGYGYGYSPYGFNSYNQRYSPYGPGNQGNHSGVNVRYSSVAIFTPQGKLIEDTGTKVDNVRLPALDQVSDFICTPQKIIQIFRNEKALVTTTTTRGPETKIIRESSPVRLEHDNDILRNEQNDEGALRHWYGNYFFVWGYETVREKSDWGGHNVFYVNKLKVD